MDELGFKRRLLIYGLALALGLMIPLVLRSGDDEFAVDTDSLPGRDLGLPSVGRELGGPDGDGAGAGRAAHEPTAGPGAKLEPAASESAGATRTAPIEEAGQATPTNSADTDESGGTAESGDVAGAAVTSTPRPSPTTTAAPRPPSTTAAPVPATTTTAAPTTTTRPKAEPDSLAFTTFTDWPIRNTSLDNRTQFVDTPANQIDWRQFTEASDRSIALGSVTANKHLGQFRTQCSFSHFAYDDPLVLPGQPGASHLHMFFGNTEANANSTYRSIRDSGSSTCNGLEGNRTGYWVPAVFDASGSARIPSRIEVYYKSHDRAFNNVVKPPEGLGMVAGTAATNPNITWACQETGAQGTNLNRPVQQRQNTIPRCSGTATLLAHIQFPQCLSGTVGPNTGNATPQLQYPTRGFFTNSCPAGTQYITAIEYFIAWNPDNHDGNTDQWWLSSDVQPDKSRVANGSTLHGDWFGGWNPQLMDQLHQNCVSRLAECSWDLVADNRRLTQVEHFGPRHQTAYGGRRAIPAAELSAALCPTDDFGRAEDAANCDSLKPGARSLGVSDMTGNSHARSLTLQFPSSATAQPANYASFCSLTPVSGEPQIT